ncbi:MAG: class I SAM-dependent methyltransferase family protein [Candidatus Diapherotrites archaeon]
MKNPRNLKEALEGKLSHKEKAFLVSSFDQVGNIAVIEVPQELNKKQKIIGEALLKVNKSIKTVCKIAGAHKGKYRIQPLKIIAGKKNFIAEYREAGCLFRFDLRKVFFSPRLAGERLRIARLIQPNEIIGAFFAGVGPYPIVFARNSPMKKAFAVELNPIAVKYLKENIALNKCAEKIEAIKGDVKKIASKKLKGKCDRIVMPLPHRGEDFLDSAFTALKPEGGIIHFYQVVPRDDPYKNALQRISETAKKFKKIFSVLYKKEVRPFSASRIQVVMDFKVH